MIKNIGGVISIAVLALVLVGVGAYLISSKASCRDFNQAQVLIDDTNTLSVAMALTPAEQLRGLGGCSSIPANSGMYFHYDSPQNVSYWMKGMLIPIDIIWIVDGRVIGIEEHVPPPIDHKTTLLPQYSPPRAVNGVLEVEAGGARKYNIAVGSTVQLLRQ